MSTCPICYDDVGDDDKITLACGHIFHYSCILESYKINNKNQRSNNIRICPYCRKDGGYLKIKENMFPLKRIHKEWEIINKEILKNENTITTNIYKYLNKDKCLAILKTGANKGFQCNKNKMKCGNFCYFHQKYKLDLSS